MSAGTALVEKSSSKRRPRHRRPPPQPPPVRVKAEPVDDIKADSAAGSRNSVLAAATRGDVCTGERVFRRACFPAPWRVCTHGPGSSWLAAAPVGTAQMQRPHLSAPREREPKHLRAFKLLAAGASANCQAGERPAAERASCHTRHRCWVTTGMAIPAATAWHFDDVIGGGNRGTTFGESVKTPVGDAVPAPYFGHYTTSNFLDYYFREGRSEELDKFFTKRVARCACADGRTDGLASPSTVFSVFFSGDPPSEQAGELLAATAAVLREIKVVHDVHDSTV
ncbi:hypothetical protein HPB47_022357 [Ixodes persulcatus]|uniref:Uncharacterized protein n=1 Tax=Ixodes persulcatus TaxID=34615 RepID=A0AC60Q9X1_IXOPE|nr:hypothetical protein HPB47_022357 [Ixodes persulcatus]